VSANFTPEYLESVKSMSQKQRVRYINVPPGDYDPEADRITQSLYLLDHPIRFQQTPEGSLCAPYALASAMHLLGFEKAAEDLAGWGYSIVHGNRSNQQYRMTAALLERIHDKKQKDYLPFNRQFQPRKMKEGTPKKEFFESLDESNLYWFTVLGSDGSTMHSVAVTRNLIIDANLNFASCDVRQH
jgi:hypothetical protein